MASVSGSGRGRRHGNSSPRPSVHHAICLMHTLADNIILPEAFMIIQYGIRLLYRHSTSA